MSLRYLGFALILSLSFGACSLGGGKKGAAFVPASTSVARATPTSHSAQRPTATSNAGPPAGATSPPTGTPAPSAAATEAPARVGVSATPDIGATPDVDPANSGGEFGPSAETREFAGRLQDAMFALERLPGYSYTVTDGSFAPGLVLTGRVSSKGSRDWMVSEQGFPDHVVGRWVLIGDKTYTEVSGKWEAIEEAPFDTDSPISFGRDYFNQLFAPYGPVSKTSKKETRIAGRTVTRYEIVRDLGVDFPQEPPVPQNGSARSTTSMWVAEDGGYLLRFAGSALFGGPGTAQRTVEVTPSRKTPEIATPKIGDPAFKGNVPPWRAVYIGKERLKALRSYAFEVTRGEAGFKVVVKGQVSDEHGRLSGTVPDFSGFSKEPPSGPEDLKTVKAQLVYVGKKAWARTGQSAWHRTSTNLASGGAPDEALTMLPLVPGGPPEGLIDREFREYLDDSVFGVSSSYDPGILTGGKLVGTETINGVKALHYKGRMRAGGLEAGGFGGGAPLSGQGASPAAADLWIATDGFYLVRLRVSGPNLPEAPPGVTGGSARTDVSDANKPFAVKPPVP